MTRTVWEYFSTQNIIFGNGAIHQINDVLNRFKAKNVLVVTDQGLVKAGILDTVLEVIRKGGFHIEVYDQAVPEAPLPSVIEAYEFAKEKNSTDVIIGIGGGSSIDLAKVIALLIKYGGHPRDYFAEGSVPGPIAPLIAIPTTAGTGSEVTQVAVVNDVENNLKVGISDNYLRPAVALLDPSLTVSLPPYVTACSGIDALSHAIESFTAIEYKNLNATGKISFQGSYPLTDALALKAIELIADNLVMAVQQGSNLEARTNMMLGSLLAGMAFSNAGNSLAHALAYPIGGKVKSPHGEVTGLLLPHAMRYNSEVAKEKMEQIRKVFNVGHGEAHPADIVEKMLEDIGLPTRLSQIGIKEEDLEEIAEKSLKIERLMRNNPRVPDKDSLVELLRKAY